ncbi:hypothetical protein BSKO_00114 [Bryopsis sp. KO-2023]|nr:hypothetical protein BSKO_00114 [Bryopsis sp. KO-2023]
MRTQPRASKPKKLVIKQLKVKPKLPQDFEQKTWDKLKEAVHAVQLERPVTSSLEELYRGVEDMCLHKMASRLYTQLQNECDLHIGRIIDALKCKLVLEPVVFLQHVDDTWNHHCSQLLTIRSIFLYLDRTYVLNTAGVKSLFDMGLQLFRVHLSVHPEVEKKTLEGLLTLIDLERNGDAVDRSLLKSLLSMFSLLGTYESGFQDQFLSRTTQFYRREVDAMMGSVDVPEYLQHCERRLTEEYERSEHYLDRITRKPLIQVVEHQILEKQMASVLDKGFAALMDANRIEDLTRLYSLCGRILAHPSLKVAFQDYIRKKGSQIMTDEGKDKEMVEKLLEFKSRLDDILATAFHSNKNFIQALKEAFEKFINQRQNKPAELTAKFIDAKLRAGNKGQTEEELEATLERVLTIFRFIHGKDVFEAFYKKDLAKRLLLGKSASIDAEKSMIGKLKAECGSQFTNKLEGMFKDMDLSKDIMKSFKQSQIAKDRSSSSIEMNVHVLTSGYWATYPIMKARLPNELETYQEVFKQFYLQKHTGRRLQWYNLLGTCTLRARFPSGLKELQVSLFQTIVLMLFNEADYISYREILESTGIEERELKRVLQSLACGKVHVLLKEPKGREVKSEDHFRFNSSFTNPHIRIKVNTIQMKETDEENKKVNDAVIQDRQYQIDAAVVRIMKMRKTLSHKLLMQELLSQVKFPLKMTDVKKRIESLIEREYVERDAHTPNVYNYLA